MKHIIWFALALAMPAGFAAEESGHEGHAHAAAPGSLEERMAQRCEHEIPTYTCDACRFEVGFVRLGPELLADGGKGLVRIEPLARRRAETVLRVTGEVQLNDSVTVHVTPRIAGIIRRVEAGAGTVVREGDTLFETESVELGEALTAFFKSRAKTEIYRRNYEREKKLFEQKVSPEIDLIEAQLRYEENQTDLAAAENRLFVFGLAEADLAALRSDDRRTLIGRLPYRAPQAGTIVARHATVGERVEPGDDIMLLSDLSKLWVWLDIYERDLAAVLERVKAGPPPVTVQTAAFAARTFQGVIDHVGSAMDETTRTVKVRAEVGNADGLLRPGMFCTADLALGGGDDVLAAPTDAVWTDEGKSYVFKHMKDDLYARVEVRPGRALPGAVEIAEGLSEGDRIVVGGAFLLKSDVLREKMGAGCAD